MNVTHYEPRRHERYCYLICKVLLILMLVYLDIILYTTAKKQVPENKNLTLFVFRFFGMLITGLFYYFFLS